MSKVAHTFKDKTRTGDVIISESVEFSNLLLSDAVLNGLKNSGFVRPSPIQLKAIPLGRCGLDLIVQAKSGTGKTCVFSVIALESLVADSASLQVLVLAPTREIAVQIWEVINSIGSAVNGLQCHTFIGGMPLHEDRMKLRKCHIAVGSPGRIKQLIETGALRTDSVRMFILDEADKLLEESFQEQINWIYSTLPENKQMLALSATYPEYLANHLTAYMRNPTFLRLNISDPALLGIRQYYQVVAYHPMSHIVFEEKTKVLSHILSTVSFQQCLVFSNLQTRAQTLADSLTKAGWPTSCIAGCLDQTERNNAMAQLKSYKCRVLISTDLTARGIDADKVNLVINMDIPKDHETYLHRIGRAGRFGSFGIAITLISEGQERLNMNSVEKKCNTQIHLLPDPIPSDLAKPDCPILLDDVVSSEVINNENIRHSLPNSPRKNGTQSYTETREETKDRKLEETEITDKSHSIETFPYLNISGRKSVTELSLKQASPVSENKFADSEKIDDDSSKDETYARTNEIRLNGCLDNDRKDSDKSDKLMPDVAINQKKTKMSCEKSLSQIGNNKNFHVGYKTENLSDNTNSVKDNEEEKDKNRNYGFESMEINDQTKFTTLQSRDSYKYGQNAEKDSPFQNLQNLNINDIIQHNIGYKKLTKYNTYQSAWQSLTEARNQRQSVSKSVAENGNQEKSGNKTENQDQSTSKDCTKVYDRLHAYCRLPRSEHSDTEVLRKAISQLQYHHECGSSSSVITSVKENIHPSTLISDPTSGNVDARNTETDDPIVDNITVRDQKSDFKSKTEDNFSAKIANQAVESSLTYGACGIGERHIERDVKLTDTDHKPGLIELKEEKLVTSGADIKMSVNSNTKTENMTTLNSKKKRFGYRGHFAIGHLLQQEREKPSDKHNDESVESVETGHVISTQTDVAKQEILTVDKNVNDERLIKRIEVLNLESGQVELNKHLKVSEALYNVDENAKLVGSEAHSLFGKPGSNGESFNHDTFQYSEEPLEKRKKNSFGASLDYVDNHITESEVENEFDDLAKSDFESSDSSCESSSEVTDSDTDSCCENIDEIHSGSRIKQNRGYKQDGACSQSRSVTSESCGSRTCDSGVYSRQSYQDYWRQWYNDWSTYCQQQGWNSSNPTWPPYGCYGNQSGYYGNKPGCFGNQFSYPNAYNGYGNPYPASIPSYPQWNYTGALRGMSAQHGPSNHQWQPYGDFRYNFYPGALNQTRSDGSSLNSPDSMQDVFKFQSEYIKQMCKNDDSRKSKDSTS